MIPSELLLQGLGSSEEEDYSVPYPRISVVTERTQQGYSLTLSLHERGVRPAFMVSYFSPPALLQAPLRGLGGPALHVNIGLFPLRVIHPSPQV